jgi:hypothetical protein
MSTDKNDFCVGNIPISLVNGVKDNVEGQSHLDIFGGDLDLTPSQWSRLEMLWKNSAMLP